ncbi:phosphate acetyltransferase [Pseudoalteromonas tunicata]|jgi:phosphate acetyltransferase|uniref:Phosphate acetyltransferase n=1 Tax=Pseudoalteromonas tunicata D2 TaxID=87626 RepID=A4CBS4_9GAMM|nr:phosphate acetyltransferase [Pseudoalteromonas tunicata]ATC94366.1 phosphate acetyltransferase [Pseudoalteromonas tunicata]AXT30105.1 phosphate acetyltransferase [Pseudoalteromonas tunicata]EAR27811.1 phosphate acetyltransferase [Pseudoalteromonas tunicata D2]MDP4982993.1 phosphate acetyltransferase [Pseudoalteromonas tunicata]MDP5211585.1 phosphate acetyltransferase [Pseudoalteromonas tunicata]
MSHRIMLIPVSTGVGLTSVSVGIVRALEQKAVRVNFFKPIAQPRAGESGPEKSTEIVKLGSNIKPPMPIELKYAEQMIGDGKGDILLEEVIARFEESVHDGEVAIIEGMVPTRKQPYAGRLNREIAQALGAEIVFVLTPGNDPLDQIEHRLEIAASFYGGVENERVLGCIFNKVNAPLDEEGRARADLAEQFDPENLVAEQNRLAAMPLFRKHPFKLLGSVPWDFELVAPRVSDLARYLKAEILNEGDFAHRRLRSVTFCARTVSNILCHFTPGVLLVTPGDRSDVLVAACLSAMNGTKIGAILLTGGFIPEDRIMKLCEQAMATGLPILSTQADTWRTSLLLHNFNMEVPIDDEQRIERVKDHNAAHLDADWLQSLTKGVEKTRKMSPPAFRHLLTTKARLANKTIVLPEGTEPRTIKAAAICGERGIAKTVLLGEREEILRIAEQQGVQLNDAVTIIDPVDVRENYVAPLVELRKNKGMTEVIAQEQLLDNTVLATMMLAQGQVDGLVSGAVNTTANTIRPPLQLVKTAPGSSLVSSIFFMLLPDQVLVYGDCAINPDPTAEQLADIAIQSADSAIAFGIDAKVAMISYSTGTSGVGADVEKVRLATELAQAKRPDLIIDGPLQYDAAIMESVARKKAPNSLVAGKATVFIFPDLNTGNTTYKAVQRSAKLISIGPMLQGMRKPVNDLSRGALVDDIVYTIALTAIQATQVTH